MRARAVCEVIWVIGEEEGMRGCAAAWMAWI